MEAQLHQHLEELVRNSSRVKKIIGTFLHLQQRVLQVTRCSHQRQPDFLTPASFSFLVMTACVHHFFASGNAPSTGSVCDAASASF